MTKFLEHKAIGSQNQFTLGKKDFYVLGVGASAGGLEAIHEFFDNFPNHSNISFVIVQHLSSDYKSLLAELIAKHTDMKVSEATDQMPLQPNCIYVIPNKKLMTVNKRRLRLTDKRAPHIPNNAIDVFFFSLAEELKDCAIGVVLSGTGSDGTKGLEAIKKCGGFTLVQEPSSAKFDGMPSSAIASGNADLVGAPKDMPKIILEFVKKGQKVLHKPLPKFKEGTVSSILTVIKTQTGQDFTHYKKPTILRRIEKRMRELGITNLADYYKIIYNSREEVDKLSKDFLIGVTKFFRDKDAFDALRDSVIPAICKDKGENDVLKIWVAACSMGEEAYSIAILINEYLQKENLQVNVKIFASDLDKEAVDYASKGRYPLSIKQDVSPERLEQFFTQEKDFYCINPHIRKMVIFAQHDITKDPPFSKMDIISCRNLLIYLDPFLQNKVLSAFNFSLNLGGFLFLGTSEHAGDLKADFLEVDKKSKIYQKIRASAKSNLFVSEGLSLKSPVVSPASNYKSAIKPRISDIFAEALSEQFGSAGVIVDGSYNIVQGIGDYTHYLHLPEKDLSFNLLKMVPEDLAYVIGSSVRRALSQKKKVSSKVKYKRGKSTLAVDVSVKPLDDSGESQPNLVFILFNKNKVKTISSTVEFIDKTTESSQRLEDLEEELKETKQNLQSIVEELETSNEELQSSNEELISANEELQSTNEELQSLNEELHTVNTEHQLKIRELIELNDDLNNFFRSADIGQIFLDANLNIRKFTPASKDLINLIETDIGRPITHISNNIKSTNLLSDIKEAKENGITVEKEIELEDGSYYLTRVLPYLRQDKRVDGVVITFVDITDLKNLNSLLSGILNSSLSGIMALKPIFSKEHKILDFEWIMVNEATERLLTKSGLTGAKLLKVFPQLQTSGLFERLVRVFSKREAIHFEDSFRIGEVVQWFEIIAVRMENGVALTLTDINEKKAAEQQSKLAYDELKRIEGRLLKLNNELEERVEQRTRELALSEERFRLISQATNDAIWDWNLVTNKRWWNEGYRKIFGYENGSVELGIEAWSNKIHPDDKERTVKSIYDAINYGSRLWSGEYRFLKSDGIYAYILDRGEVLHDENGVPYRMLGSMVDLTESRKAQESLYVKNRELQKINDLLDTFVYTAAHDLKSPVANLRILVELLKDKGESGRKDLLKAIDLSIKRLDNTINGLVEIVETRSYDTSKIKRIKFKDILERILSDYKTKIEESGAIISADFSQYSSIVYIEAYLQSILNNLISNALKYSSKERRPEIRIETTSYKDLVLLSVKDNGIGMDLEKYGKNLFKPFNRFAKHVEGTGIGLHLVKNMVENNDGTIEVESKPNEGTLFKLFLREYSS